MNRKCGGGRFYLVSNWWSPALFSSKKWKHTCVIVCIWCYLSVLPHIQHETVRLKILMWWAGFCNLLILSSTYMNNSIKFNGAVCMLEWQTRPLPKCIQSLQQYDCSTVMYAVEWHLNKMDLYPSEARFKLCSVLWGNWVCMNDTRVVLNSGLPVVPHSK